MTDLSKLAEGLSPSKKAAILWCHSDGSPRQHEKGAPSRGSFWALEQIVKGNPAREVALFYKFVVRGEGGKVKGRIWPENTWALTPLGLALKAHLQSEGEV